MTAPRFGSLFEPRDAPAVGERAELIVAMAGLAIEQIASGTLPGPLDYDQDRDEWALVVQGEATLEVAGQRRTLTSGEWALLPAHVRHRVVSARPGTTWLTVREAR